MLPALAFVPEPDVFIAFEDVSEDFPLDGQAVIDYFEDTYIGRLRPGGHRRVPLVLGLCNMYNQTLDDLPRTNNAVEGWHRSFQANVGAYHPNFWKFIDILKREQNLPQVNIAQARAGHQPEPQRRRYLDSNQRIKNIVQDYHNHAVPSGLSPQHQHVKNTSSHVSALCQPKRFFKTTNVTEVILVAIALSISYEFRGLCPGGFCP